MAHRSLSLMPPATVAPRQRPNFRQRPGTIEPRTYSQTFVTQPRISPHMRAALRECVAGECQVLRIRTLDDVSAKAVKPLDRAACSGRLFEPHSSPLQRSDFR